MLKSGDKVSDKPSFQTIAQVWYFSPEKQEKNNTCGWEMKKFVHNFYPSVWNGKILC
jgi:hypothetical protein